VLQQSGSLFWDNTNVRLGVGTASPVFKLDVANTTGVSQIGITSAANSLGDINFINSGYGLPRWTIRGQGAANGSSGVLVFQRLASTNVMSLTENMNVLIGTSTDAGFKLDVNGTARVNSLKFQLSANSQIAVAYAPFPTLRTFFDYEYELSFRNVSLSSAVALIIHRNTNNIGIGTTTDVASSILTVESTTKGFLPPRMTTTQKNAIASPAAGLVVYDTTLNKLCVRGAASWETITSI
jgi:hypothetical protein